MLFNILNIVLIFGALGMYSGYLLLDDKMLEEDVRNKRVEYLWHLLGAFVFAVIGFTFYRFIGWRYVPFVFACAWLLFAGLIHVIALARDFFYVGTTAITDRIQQGIAKLLHINVIILSALLKISFLILSILWMYNVI